MARNAGSIKVQTLESILRSKWVQPFPRTRMRPATALSIIPQGLDTASLNGVGCRGAAGALVPQLI